ILSCASSTLFPYTTLFRSCLIALLVQLQLHGPRSGPRCCILDRGGVFERVCIEPCPAFNQMQVFAGSLEVRFRREIGDVDNQCRSEEHTSELQVTSLTRMP